MAISRLAALLAAFLFGAVASLPSVAQTKINVGYVQTADTLRNRIRERFPESGLSKLAGELHEVAKEGMGRTAWIEKPNLPLRALMVCLIAAIGVILFRMLGHLQLPKLLVGNDEKVSRAAGGIKDLDSGKAR